MNHAAQQGRGACQPGALSALFVLLACPTHTLAAEPAWQQTGTVAAEEAVQAAAADERHVYAITNSLVARYDRRSGQRLAKSSGAALHLNSGFLWEGKLYCAHSNYPRQPEESEIKVLDLETMALSTFYRFAENRGSLTWAVRHDGAWWCNFAHYGADNAKTVLVRFDDQWQEQAAWTYPTEVVSRLGRYSISGGVWRDGRLLVTGHDERAIYRLRLPEQGRVLEYIDALAAPFTGQGIAVDSGTGGLVGIDRARRQVVFAELRK
jgi:hypothetical protein